MTSMNMAKSDEIIRYSKTCEEAKENLDTFFLVCIKKGLDNS